MRRFLLAAVLPFTVVTWNSYAAALGSSARPVIEGDLPDVIFPAGQAMTKRINYRFTDIGSGRGWGGFWAINAGSTIPGVKVINSYGDEGHEASTPCTTGVGPATAEGAHKDWSFDIKAEPWAREGVGTINLYALTTEFFSSCETLDSPHLTLIGQLNVYVTRNNFTTTFTLTATADNTVGNALFFSHPFASAEAGALFFATSNWNPPQSIKTFNDHPIGVAYVPELKKWKIYNEDGKDMPLGASFNVRLEGVQNSGAAKIHTATTENIRFNWTEIDDPITNDNPFALVYVTHNGTAGDIHTKNIGVWYTGRRWAIFNQDLSPMQPGTHFNVKTLGLSGSLLNGPPIRVPLFGADVQFGNASPSSTLINRWPYAGASAIYLATPNWNPNGVGGTYNNHVTGVSFIGPFDWAVFNQDSANMPSQAAFNIWKPRPTL